MALRILFLIIAFVLVVNIVLSSVGLVTGINLYQKYGKQILNFFTIFVLFIIAVYVILALVALK